MDKNDIGFVVSQSIKENCWISIKYFNIQKEYTYFWCVIEDIDIDRRKLQVVQYNKVKYNDRVLLDTWINFDGIMEASLINGTTNSDNGALIEKLNTNIDKINWLHYDTFNTNILKYYEMCTKYDRLPYIKALNLIEKIDLSSFDHYADHKIDINSIQLIKIIENVFNEPLVSLNKLANYKAVDLAINILSIAIDSNKVFCIAYKLVKVDLKNKKLELCQEILINKDFIDNNTKYSMHRYLELDIDYFVNDFRKNPHEYIERIKMNCKRGELIDERPYLNVISRDMGVDLQNEYAMITTNYMANNLSTPLTAFFGNMSKNLQRKNRKVLPITLLDERVNIDQLRAIFNAMKNSVTYIQGPPGTGKTQTIINIIISALFNNKSVIVASNNNKPIEGIYEKMRELKYSEQKESLVLYAPILRIGNSVVIDNALDEIKMWYYKYKDLNILNNVLSNYEQTSGKSITDLSSILEKYEEKEELEIQYTVLSQLVESLNELQKYTAQYEIEKIEKRLNQIGNIYDEDALNTIKIDKFILNYMHQQGIKRLQLLSNPSNSDLLNIINALSDCEETKVQRRSAFLKYLKDDECLKRLMKIFPIILTTNMSSAKIGTCNIHFDYAIMDEAGQCSIAYSLLPIARAERLVLVGDENQLEPVIVLDKELNNRLMHQYKVTSEYNYVTNSIISTMQSVDHISKYVLLRSHYRCVKKIINFSNKRYYENQLIMVKPNTNANSLEIIDVKTKGVQDRNTSIYEIDAINYDIIKNDYYNVGIVTPFRNQADLIKDQIKNKEIESGTVHTFQGEEKEVIYITCAISEYTDPQTYNWMCNNRELINVASTRAKNKLVLVGDIKEIKRRGIDDDINALINYMEMHGNTNEININSDLLSLTKNNSNVKRLNTKAEKDFIATISHYLTCNTYGLVGKSKVKVSSILKKYPLEDFDYFTRSEFDYVLFASEIPVLAIEIDGVEHYTSSEAAIKDQKKKDICSANGIELVRIANIDIRMYEYIKATIEDILMPK